MLATCFSTAPPEMTRAAAIPALERPSAIRASTSRSRGVSAGQAAGVAAGAEELADHLRVEGGAAGGDPGQRVGELGHVGDPVLEQVADPGGAALQQPGGVPGLDVLGEHQHAGPGMPAAELDGGPQSLVGVGGRHPDVDHGDVGTVLGHGGEQGVAVGHGGGAPGGPGPRAAG